MKAFRIANFVFGIILFVLNVWFGFKAALRGSGLVFLSILAIIMVAWSLDSQWKSFRAKEDQ